MHLTVRMAWHDNNWNGKVCQNPAGNTYCTGAHSLLSGRIEKKKDIEKEEEFKGRECNKLGVDTEFITLPKMLVGCQSMNIQSF